MKELVLVVVTALLAHGIAWCRDPMASWRQKQIDDCQHGVEEFNRIYRVEMTSDGAVTAPRWMTE